MFARTVPDCDAAAVDCCWKTNSPWKYTTEKSTAYVQQTKAVKTIYESVTI